MQYFDGEIDKFVRAGMISYDDGMAWYATNPGSLRLELADYKSDEESEFEK